MRPWCESPACLICGKRHGEVRPKPQHRADVPVDSCSAGRRWGKPGMLARTPCEPCGVYEPRHRAEPTS